MKRNLTIAVIVLASFLLQTSICPQIPYMNAVPNLLLIVTFAWGFLRGRTTGMIVGFISGLLLDLFYSESVGFYALFYMYAGYANGMLSSLLVTDIIVLPVVLCAITDIAYHFYVYIFAFIIKRRLAFPVYWKEIIMPEVLLTVIIGIVVYGLLMLIDRKLRDSEKGAINLV